MKNKNKNIISYKKLNKRMKRTKGEKGRNDGIPLGVLGYPR